MGFFIYRITQHQGLNISYHQPFYCHRLEVIFLEDLLTVQNGQTVCVCDIKPEWTNVKGLRSNPHNTTAQVNIYLDMSRDQIQSCGKWNRVTRGVVHQMNVIFQVQYSFCGNMLITTKIWVTVRLLQWKKMGPICNC